MRANVGGDRNDRAFMGESVVTDQPIREVSVERPSDGSNGSTTTAEAHNCSLFWPPLPHSPRTGAGPVKLAAPPANKMSGVFPTIYGVLPKNLRIFTDIVWIFPDETWICVTFSRKFAKSGGSLEGGPVREN